MLGFFQKGVGGRVLRLQAPVISTIYIYIIDIPSRISKGDKSEKWYFSYILYLI
jgi:hypothetical protein